MSASTENAGPRAAPRAAGALAAAWRPAGVIYLAVLLAGLAAGMWPEAIYPSREAIRAAPLPALPALAVAQAAFILLIYPLVVLARADKGAATRLWPAAIVETAAMILVTAPFYVVAAWLGDAVAADVVRVALYVACLWTVAWSAGGLLRRFRGARPAVLLTLLVVAAGLPAAYYIAIEFLAAPGEVEWLWRLAPGTFAWQTAGSRVGSWLPRPLWAALVWPAAAAAGAGVQLLWK